MHPPADLSSEEEPAGRKEQTPDPLGQGRAGAVIPEWGKVLMSPRPGGPVPLQCHPTRELVIHAAGLFGDLQSFMRQELDEAMATQALWPTLSSRLRVSSTPEGRSEKTPPQSSGGPLGGSSCLLHSPCFIFPTQTGQWLKQVSVTFLCPAIFTHLLSTS